jgi:predicted KAP-like P-loop ATPase
LFSPKVDDIKRNQWIVSPESAINRIQSLLSILDSTERLVDEKESVLKLINEQMDFSNINKLLADLRNEATVYLDKVLYE